MLIKGSNNPSGFEVTSKDQETSNFQDENNNDCLIEPADNESAAAGKSKGKKTSKKSKNVIKEATTSLKNKCNSKFKEHEIDYSVASMPDLPWDEKGDINLHSLLVDALNKLKFQTPTPIQAAALPIALKVDKDGNGNEALCDMVGAAETGSGKTLVQ